MKGTVKYILIVILCLLCALISTHYLEAISFQDAFILLLALSALFRTCKDDADK